uniref:Homeobox transcription factor HD60 n=1 Tax=Mnemiopsis leidyi TaxID=27923 RepID=E3UJX8_MNELE|nr:homeobox transcription factor HD60 [Mnemiopsis leidyi]
MDASYAPAQLVLATNTDSFPQLNVYKQNSTLLNIMGYNCTNSRNKPFRRHRTRFNDEQVAAMERYYTNISRYARPDNGLPELIRETGLTHDTIMLWFQNKRARDKRKGWDDTGGGSSGDGKRAKTE